MRLRPHGLAWACALALLPAASAGAQQARPPDAGQALRSQEQRPLPPPSGQTLELPLPDAASGQDAGQAEGASVRVAGFSLEGNSAIGSDELLALLADLRGRTLTLAQLQAGAGRITTRYRERGYPLARAYLPAQAIDGGVVRIAVLEGRYGQVEVHNASALRASAVAAPLRHLQPGQAVRAVPLERALLTLRELAGAQASATLRPGAQVGTTDLVVDVQPAQRLVGSIEADNSGNRYTGQYRVTGHLDVNSPLRLGDRLSLQVLATDQDQHQYRAAWQVPVGSWGTQLGTAWSRMDYSLGRDFADLDAHGTARVASAWVTQPLLRRRALDLYAALQYDHKRLQDQIDRFDSLSRKRSRVLTASLYGDGHDGWLGGGATSISLSWSHGRLDLDSALDRVIDRASAGTAGSFNVVRPSLARLQRLGGRWSLYAQAQGQWSDGNLDSSEKFYLGGAYGVRAYPQAEGAGDQGWLASLELRCALDPAWRVSTFADHGAVRINKDPWDQADNHRGLSGAGVGLDWAAHGWQAGASAAWKLGNARVQDGGGHSPQLWVHLARGF